MNNNLLHEIIQLKEEKKMYEAVCGNRDVEDRIFNRNEQERMRHMRCDTRSEIVLEGVEKRLEEDERTFRQEHH